MLASLDTAHLKDGTVVYQNTSDTVRFKLAIYLADRLTVNESILVTRRHACSNPDNVNRKLRAVHSFWVLNPTACAKRNRAT